MTERPRNLRRASRLRAVAIERAGAQTVTVDPEAGALFRAEWEFRRDYGDNRPIEVEDLDGAKHALRPRDVVEVRNCYGRAADTPRTTRSGLA